MAKVRAVIDSGLPPDLRETSNQKSAVSSR